MPRACVVVVGLVVWVLACGAAGAAPPSSGIVGHVVSAPTCPVQTVAPQPRCAPRPLASTLRISRVGSRSKSKLVHSGADGSFRVRLSAATYLVQALPRPGSRLPVPPAASRVRVPAGHFAVITITYDTGIR